MERVRLTIGGMSCGHCVGAVGAALAQLPGIEVERVDVGSAVVAYDPAAVEPAQIADAIARGGYEVREVGRAT